MRVLVVERSAFLRLVLREMLARANHETVGECGEIGEATTMAKNLGPDVVLLDLEGSHNEWPDGISKLHNGAPTARLIALGPPGTPAEAPGIEAYLSKPCSPEAVLAAIRRCTIRDGIMPA